MATIEEILETYKKAQTNVERNLAQIEQSEKNIKRLVDTLPKSLKAKVLELGDLTPANLRKVEKVVRKYEADQTEKLNKFKTRLTKILEEIE